jgi:hypothetical protein
VPGMDSIGNIWEKMRIFYYSTLIPVNLLEKDKSIFSMPDNIHYAGEISDELSSLNQMLNLPESYEESKVSSFYYKNEFEECLIILEIDKDRHLIAGPALTEKIHEDYINIMIRQKRLPIGIKNKLIGHYEKLPVIDNHRLYYCGKLMDNLFCGDIRPRVLCLSSLTIP